VSATNQDPASGAPVQPRQKVRARRGQATDPHSIAERVCYVMLISHYDVFGCAVN
jgi:hypothetical protein